MTHLIRTLALDFMHCDYFSCKGALDYLLHDKFVTQERLIRFMRKVYGITEYQALEVLEILDAQIIH